MTDETENVETNAEDDWAAAMAEQAIADSAQEVAAQPAEIFPSFAETDGKASMMNELDMILDIPVQVAVELGRTKITIKSLLQLAHGSVVELDAMAGEPMTPQVAARARMRVLTFMRVRAGPTGWGFDHQERGSIPAVPRGVESESLRNLLQR